MDDQPFLQTNTPHFLCGNFVFARPTWIEHEVEANAQGPDIHWKGITLPFAAKAKMGKTQQTFGGKCKSCFGMDPTQCINKTPT